MKITVNIYYTGINGNARKFVEEMESSGIASAIRNEEGNLKYEYYFHHHDTETVLLIDSWRDQASIDEHHKTPMMDAIIALRNKYDLHMKVERYLDDENGIPEHDEQFIVD